MLKPLKILIVDDTESIRRIVKEILCGAPSSVFQCQSVGTFKECLEICEAKETDYVILDLDLPDKLGFEGLAELHEKYKHIGVIILTGHHNQNDAIRATNEYGVLAYITKPIEDINLFYKAIADAIVRHKNEVEINSKVSFKQLGVYAGIATTILTFLSLLIAFGKDIIELLRKIF